jgi:hypothetical protein
VLFVVVFIVRQQKKKGTETTDLDWTSHGEHSVCSQPTLLKEGLHDSAKREYSERRSWEVLKHNQIPEEHNAHTPMNLATNQVSQTPDITEMREKHTLKHSCVGQRQSADCTVTAADCTVTAADSGKQVEQKVLSNRQELERVQEQTRTHLLRYANLSPKHRAKFKASVPLDKQSQLLIAFIDKLLDTDVEIRVQFFRNPIPGIADMVSSQFERESKKFTRNLREIGKGTFEDAPFTLFGYRQTTEHNADWVIEFAWKTSRSYHFPQVTPFQFGYVPSPPSVFLIQGTSWNVRLALENNYLRYKGRPVELMRADVCNLHVQ